MTRNPSRSRTWVSAALAALALAGGLAPGCHHFSPDAPDREGYTPLMRAAEAGDVEEIRRLLERGAHTDYQGRRVTRISLLFPFTDTTVEDEPYHRWTPLIVAARAGQAGAITALLGAGADPDLRGHDGTALRLAAEADQAAAVRALLAGGADWKVRDDAEGRMPILAAIERGHRDAVRAFLEAGADLGSDSFHAENAMLEAVARGQAELVCELFDAGVVHLRNVVGRERERVFLEAIGHRHMDVARIPVDAIVDLPARVGPEQGWSLLAAIGRGDPDVATALIAAGIDLRAPVGSALVAAAAAAGQPAVVRALAGAGAPLDAADRDGATPLVRAASAGQVEALRALLDAGAGIDVAGRNGRTALMHAAEADHASAVRTLLERGAALEAKDAGGWTAWMVAERAGRVEAARILREAGADTSRGARSLELADAVARGDLPALRAALHAGADPDAGDDSGTRALEVAVRAERVDLVQALLAGGADANAKRGGFGYTPLGIAVEKGKVDLMRALLAGGAAPDAPAQQGQTPLLAAVGTGLEEVVRTLVLAGADLCAATPSGETALARARRIEPGYAHSGGSIPKVALLLAELGAETDPARCSPLLIAAVRGDPAQLEPHARTADRAALDRALVAAASAGRPEAVRILLGRGADPNALGPTGRTPLVAAADGGHAEVLRALVAAGAEARRPAADGTTPLLAATRAGRAEVVTALREAGVEDPLELGGLEAALIEAARAGDTARVRALVAAGAQIDWSEEVRRSKYQKPALFAAAEAGQTEALRALLEAGADVNSRKMFFYTHTTPLLTAVLEGRADSVAALIAAGADVNYRDERGTTPLSVARGQAEGNYLGRRAEFARIVALLERAGARDEEAGDRG